MVSLVTPATSDHRCLRPALRRRQESICGRCSRRCSLLQRWSCASRWDFTPVSAASFYPDPTSVCSTRIGRSRSAKASDSGEGATGRVGYRGLIVVLWRLAHLWRGVAEAIDEVLLLLWGWALLTPRGAQHRGRIAVISVIMAHERVDEACLLQLLHSLLTLLGRRGGYTRSTFRLLLRRFFSQLLQRLTHF